MQSRVSHFEIVFFGGVSTKIEAIFHSHKEKTASEFQKTNPEEILGGSRGIQSKYSNTKILGCTTLFLKLTAIRL